MYEKILQGTIDYWKGVLNDDTIEILPESNLMDDLALSSLEMLNGLIMLEDTYDILIPEKCLKRMITVADVALVIAEIAGAEK